MLLPTPLTPRTQNKARGSIGKNGKVIVVLPCDDESDIYSVPHVALRLPVALLWLHRAPKPQTLSTRLPVNKNIKRTRWPSGIDAVLKYLDVFIIKGCITYQMPHTSTGA